MTHRDDQSLGGGLLDMLGSLLGGRSAPSGPVGGGGTGGGLTEMVLAQFTPDVVRAISARLGVDESIVRMGLTVVVPLLLAGLARNSRTPEGAGALSDALRKDHDGTVLGRVPQAVDNYSSGPGAGILRHVLGDQRQPVQRSLSEATGADGGAMLQMTAPVVLGALGKVQREQNLDADGLSNLLQQEQQQLGQSGDLMQVVIGLLDTDRDGSLGGEASGLLGRLFGR